MRIGYIRVSSEEQNIERQLQEITLDKTFIDKVSGKNTNRIQFQIMMEFLREGDCLIVHSMDRLARNLDDLRSIVQKLTKKGVSVEFIKEGLKFSGDDSPISILTLSIMGAFAEFERSIIRERQKEGIEIAKKKGVYKGREKCMKDTILLKEKLDQGMTVARISRELGFSRPTIYKYMRTI